MNLLAELARMLQPQEVPDGAVTAKSLSDQLGISRQSAKAQLDSLTKKGTLTSRVIRTANSGGRTCEVTIYERPTGTTTATSTTSREPPSSS